MPWIKVDDHFNEHPKHAAVGPVGWGVWLAGLAYCNRNLTDGFIPFSVAEAIGGTWTVLVPDDDNDRELVYSIDLGRGLHGESMSTAWVIEQLVRVGLWEQCKGGFRVHDYDEYQPSKEEVLAEREKVRGRVSAFRNRRGNGVTTGVTNAGVTGAPVPVPVPNPVGERSIARDRNERPTKLGDILGGMR